MARKERPVGPINRKYRMQVYKKIKDNFDGLISSDEEIQAILNGKKESSFTELSSIKRKIENVYSKT